MVELMKTIILNKKRKKLLWKNIIIYLIGIILFIVGIIILTNVKINYNYYKIDIYGNKILLGTASSNNLLDITVYNKINEVKQDKFQIADYNLKNLITIQPTIKWNSFNSEDEKVKDAIEDNMFIIVYALKLNIDGIDYILPESEGYTILGQLKNKNPNLNIDLLDGEFVNIEKVLTEAEIEELISNYK